MMELKTVLMLLIAFGVMMTPGCVSNNPVQTQEDVTTNVGEIATDVGDLNDALTDIDSDLG
jgi:outer membrane murein-binding lipoprotein Lpp